MMGAVLLLLLGGCTRTRQSDEFEGQGRNEFEGQGRIRGSFRLGDETLTDGWVEMIQLTGPTEERCGPGDCGLSMDALSAGEYWNPGTWRVIAPPVEGWKPPTPFEIVVRPDKLTRFEGEYERA
jgi:hypothetical protein